jgi:hypothetical protein
LRSLEITVESWSSFAFTRAADPAGQAHYFTDLEVRFGALTGGIHIDCTNVVLD